MLRQKNIIKFFPIFFLFQFAACTNGTLVNNEPNSGGSSTGTAAANSGNSPNTPESSPPPKRRQGASVFTNFNSASVVTTTTESDQSSWNPTIGSDLKTDLFSSEDSKKIGSYIITGQRSRDISLTGFFSPTDLANYETKTLTGIEVKCRWAASNPDSVTANVTLIKDGTDKGPIQMVPLPTPMSYSGLGGTSDLWESGLNLSDVLAEDFGIKLHATNLGVNSFTYIDTCQVRIHYTDSAVQSYTSDLAGNVAQIETDTGIPWTIPSTQSAAEVTLDINEVSRMLYLRGYFFGRTDFASSEVLGLKASCEWSATVANGIQVNEFSFFQDSTFSNNLSSEFQAVMGLLPSQFSRSPSVGSFLSTSGLTISPEQLTSSTFGIALRLQNVSSTATINAYVNYCRVEAFTTPN